MSKELNLKRTFNAPIDRVWDAWTKPEPFSKWYGQPGNVDPNSVELDVREGGEWKATTVGEDGTKYPFSGNYTKIEAPNKLVLTFKNPMDPSDPNTEVVTVLLTERDGQTEMNFTQSGNLPDEEYEVGLRKGWTGFFDALDSTLK
jgi:uncharacterized protein YndB with AHSA1/START domain